MDEQDFSNAEDPVILPEESEGTQSLNGSNEGSDPNPTLAEPYSSEEPIYNADPSDEEGKNSNPSRDPGSLSNLFGG